MGTVCYLRQIEASQVKTLLADPRKVLVYLFGRIEEPPRRFYDRVLGKSNPVREDIDALFRAPLIEVNLETAWHGIHYLLTGSDWEGEQPLCYLVLGGVNVGDIDVGNGPARVLSEEQVKIFSDALGNIDIETLKKRYDAKEMAGLDIYPGIWKGDSQIPDPLEYLLRNFDKLKAFSKLTAERNKCMLIYFS